MGSIPIDGIFILFIPRRNSLLLLDIFASFEKAITIVYVSYICVPLASVLIHFLYLVEIKYFRTKFYAPPPACLSTSSILAAVIQEFQLDWVVPPPQKWSWFGLVSPLFSWLVVPPWCRPLCALSPGVSDGPECARVRCCLGAEVATSVRAVALLVRQYCWSTRCTSILLEHQEYELVTHWNDS